VGFPGETDAHFLETYNFINSLDISYLHVFTYSERSNTAAAEMDGVVPIPERKRRNKMLRILSEKKTRLFYESQIGTSRPILFESENRGGYMFGYTDNYVRVKTFWNPDWANKIKTFSLARINNDGIVILDIPKNAINATDFHRI
jgi:threonylcarbamoyladenosine tRNA methylthiotransferase MtaB